MIFNEKRLQSEDENRDTHQRISSAIYGGAGVHVENLTRELWGMAAGTHRIEVLCFGNQSECRPGLRVQGVDPWGEGCPLFLEAF
jgi:hypothetical protein